MRSVLLSALFIVSFSSEYPAQTDRNSITYSFGITRFDFFSGFGFQRKFNHFTPFSELQFGVNRTIFQQRVFPKFRIGCYYDLLKSDVVHLSPTLTYGYSFLKVNAAEGTFHRWHEAMFGFRIQYGRKFRSGLFIEGGYAAERFHDSILSKTRSHHLSSYQASLIFAYAL